MREPTFRQLFELSTSSSRRTWRLKRLTGYGLLLMVATLLVSAFAAAQESDAGGKALESIRQRMEQGLALFVAGDTEKAAQEFETGYSEHPYSAFLFNAGVCYQKQNNAPKALEKFREYLRIDPDAPDIDKVRERIAALEAASQAQPQAPAAPTAGEPTPPAPPPVVSLPADTANAMRSLVVIETEPSGAPIQVYLRRRDDAAPFSLGGENAGWKQVVTGTSPTSLSLAVGSYHVVVNKFRDFNASETDLQVLPGHVHQFKANLSQGVFMSFLRVSANVPGAHIWLDDRTKHPLEWGTTPYGELVPAGAHRVSVEAPGFKPLVATVDLSHGEQKELEVRLTRVDYGFLRIDGDAPQLEVSLDDKPVGVWKSGEPPLDVKSNAGKHRLTLSADGRKDFEGTVDVPKGQVLPIHGKMIPKYPRGAAWTQAIFSAAFIGAGAFFGNESKKLKKDLEDDRAAGVLESGDSRITRGRIFAIGADAGFVVGGVLAIMSTYNFIKDPFPDSSTKQDKPIEFNDPLRALPTASLGGHAPSRIATRRQSNPVSSWHIQASAGEQGGAIFVGGSF